MKTFAKLCVITVVTLFFFGSDLGVGLEIPILHVEVEWIPIGGSPSPIKESGLHVMIVEDVGHREQLPKDQFDALTSTVDGSLLGYIQAHSKVYRQIDKSDDLKLDDPVWQDIFQRFKATNPQVTPWIGAYDPKRGYYEGPINADTLSKLKRVGGE